MHTLAAESPAVLHLPPTQFRGALEHDNAFTMTGTGHCFVSGRLSYVLNLHGACESIDVACSAALVACHDAHLAVRTGDCSTALLAGVNMIFLPSTLDGYAAAGLTSPTGVPYVFDRRASGFVRGEGCGTSAVQRAERGAQKALPFVIGSAVRQDGRSASLTAPNGRAQQLLLSGVIIASAGIQPTELRAVEAWRWVPEVMSALGQQRQVQTSVT